MDSHDRHISPNPAPYRHRRITGSRRHSVPLCPGRSACACGVVAFGPAEEGTNALPSVWRREPGRQAVLQELRRFADSPRVRCAGQVSSLTTGSAVNTREKHRSSWRGCWPRAPRRQSSPRGGRGRDRVLLLCDRAAARHENGVCGRRQAARHPLPAPLGDREGDATEATARAGQQALPRRDRGDPLAPQIAALCRLLARPGLLHPPRRGQVPGERLELLQDPAIGRRDGRAAPAGHPPGARTRPELVATAPLRVWSWDIERHEALPNREEVRGLFLPARRSGPLKLRAAQAVGRRGGRQAALTKPGRIRTVRWFGSGEHDGKVYVRNQRRNASQETSTSFNLTDGWAAARIGVHRAENSSGGDVAVREATVKVCGVAVARPQGHSWAPNPLSGSRVNVGTPPAVPHPASRQLAGGKARRRLMPPEGDGGAVVVRGRESRSHGEGVQRDGSDRAERGGRR